MNKNKKVLLSQIKDLLRGPIPERVLVYFEGEYHLRELIGGIQTIEIITQDQAKIILDADPDMKVSFIYQNNNEPPESITDELERYEWIRANPIDPYNLMPEEIRGRIVPPEGMIISVHSRECGAGLIDLLLNGVNKYQMP